MRELKFRYASAKNFICFGPQGIELFFDDYGQLILVKGQNWDYTTNDGQPGSNAAGKSSLQDIISYGLYGKTVKKPKQLFHGDVINTISGKGLEVEVQFDDIRVVRCRQPNKLRVWESKDHLWDDTTELDYTKHSAEDFIKGKVGLTHRAFCGVMVFDDGDAHSFLEADAKDKREIVENLLGLDKYREYLEVAKKLRKDAAGVVEDLTKDYERIVIELKSCDKRIGLIEEQEKTWQSGVKRWLADAVQKIKQKQLELQTTDLGQALVKFQEAQDKMLDVQDSIIEITHKRDKLGGIIKEAHEKLSSAQASRFEVNAAMQQHQLGIKAAQAQIAQSQALIGSLLQLEDGKACPTCHGLISKVNANRVIEHERNVISQSESKIAKESTTLEVLKQKFGERSAAISKLEGHVAQANKSMEGLEAKLKSLHHELAELGKVKKPQGNSAQQLLEAEITELKRQCQEKTKELDGGSPYKEILEKAIEEKDNKKQEVAGKESEIKVAEAVLPYYEFWVEAFGDKGIRRFIVNGIIPALNSRIAYWLQHLIDNKIELTFNDKLEETVFRNGTAAIYHSMSKSEKRRINLAVSQAFSYVMTLHAGCCPSLVFLDEVTGGIDEVGVTGVYNMVFELAKERQVLVTTHDKTLLEMLDGCETITLKKQHDITVLA